MYNVGNTVNFKSPDGVIQIDITLSDLIDISEGKGDLYSPIELNDNLLTEMNFSFYYDVWGKDQIFIMNPDSSNGFRMTTRTGEYFLSREFKYFHELQDIYKALTGKHLILK